MIPDPSANDNGMFLRPNQHEVTATFRWVFLTETSHFTGSCPASRLVPRCLTTAPRERLKIRASDRSDFRCQRDPALVNREVDDLVMGVIMLARGRPALAERARVESTEDQAARSTRTRPKRTHVATHQSTILQHL